MAKRKSTGGGEQIHLGERIFRKSMEDCLHDSMIPYAEYVLLDRALPRIEDGLKPVQRRILYSMYELGITSDKPHRKSARVVGDCLAKYHPHGDSSVYDALVRMAQDFIMREPLVDGHGNFGSVDGDSAAAMRYTEARMTPLAQELLVDIEKNTVEFELNFDDSEKEPVVLPAKFPNLLVNGASGIAVGLATSIPPHNLTETINACVAVIDNPDITIDELMEVIPAPDFPTGGYLVASDEIKKAFETGSGRLINRAKTHVEQIKNGKSLIVITELPYQVNKANLLKRISDLCQEKKASIKALSQISEIRDESDRHGMRAVIELKRDADSELVLNCLFKHTDLQKAFNVNMVTVAEGKPVQLGLRGIIDGYLKHRKSVVTRRTEFELEAAKKRGHILDGLMIAILNIDEVIALIRASKSPKEAKEGLISRFELSEIQAQAILDLRLQRLTNMEQIAIEKEAKEIRALIKRLTAILNDNKLLMGIIKKELEEERDKYGSPRKTEIIAAAELSSVYVDEAAEKPSYPVLLELFSDAQGDISILKRQKNVPTVEEGAPLYSFDTETDKYLKLFTASGDCITLSIDDLPELLKSKSKTGKATRLATLVALNDNEKIVYADVVDITAKNDDVDYMFYTKNGNVKRTPVSDCCTKKQRILVMTIKDNDEVIGIERLNHADIENRTVIMITKGGMSIRFTADSVPSVGRTGAGVKAIKLDINDYCVFASLITDDGEILVVTDRGYAKRTFVFDYDIQGRNGKGLKTIDFKKNGSNGKSIISAFYLTEPIQIKLTQSHGMESVIDSDMIRLERRASSGSVVVLSVLDDVIVSAKAVRVIPASDEPSDK